MVHTTKCSPLSATIAVIAAGAVGLATTTIEPPKPPAALTAPTISTQAVHLTALAGPLQAASVSVDLPNIGDVLQGIPTTITQGVKGVIFAPVAGAAAGIVFGFFGGAILTGNLLSWVPEELSPVVTPVIWAGGVLGAIIGAPIGAVAVPIISAASWLSGILSPRNAAATASASVPAAGGRNAIATASARVPHRTTQPGVRPHRSIAKPSASSASKDSVPQQHSKSARNGTGHARAAASKRPARH